MKDIKSEDIHKVVKGLISMCEMREFLKKHEEEDYDEDENEDEDLEEKKQEEEMIKRFHNESKEMYQWAFGNIEYKMDKDIMCKRWSKLHPDLPDFFMPYKTNNNMANIIMFMQIIPLWHEFKKKGKS